MPYRSQFITATDDPLLHPPTRNAAKPPPHPATPLPVLRPLNGTPTTPPLRSPYPAGKPKTPLSLLPLLRSPARPPASSFTLHHTPLLLTRRVDCSHRPPAPSIPHHHPVPAAFLLRALPLTPPVNRHTRRLPPRLCASWPATAQHQPATPTTPPPALATVSWSVHHTPCNTSSPSPAALAYTLRPFYSRFLSLTPG